MKQESFNNEQPIRTTAFVKKQHVPYYVGILSLSVMLLWAGAYKMTAPGAEGIIPLVENSPFTGWFFKILGPYVGSDSIGITEILAAILLLIGIKKPTMGIIGIYISLLMFCITSSMLITTPETILPVKGIGYMTFLGLFLYKDLIGLSLSLFLLQEFRRRT